MIIMIYFSYFGVYYPKSYNLWHIYPNMDNMYQYFAVICEYTKRIKWL